MDELINDISPDGISDDVSVDPGHDDLGDETSKDGRSRTWMILVYEDSTDVPAFRKKLSDLDWDYAGRVHDQEAKLHHHIVVLFKNGRKNVDIANDLGIDVRWLRAWDRKNKAIRYLCHRGWPHKYQYSTDGLYGSLAEMAAKLCDKDDSKSEETAIDEIIKLLDESQTYLTYSCFIAVLNSRKLYPSFRRMGIIGTRLLDEHNTRYADDTYQKEKRQKEFEVYMKSVGQQMEDFASRCDRLEKLGFPPKEEF